MSNLVSTKKSKALFIAIVLIAGTFALLSTLFMVGTAQAQPYYEMDNYKSENGYDYDYNNDYSKKSSGVNIQKMECVNANINVNESTCCTPR